MSKPRAQGADAVQLIAKEVTYGTPVSGSGGGVYRRMPLRSDDVSAAQGLEDDDVWNKLTADVGDPALGAFSVAGDIVAPMDARGIGFLMTMALAAPVTTTITSGVLFKHLWKSGAELFSYTKQVGHPQLATPKWRTQKGGKSNGFSFPMARNGRALLTMPMIFQGEVKDTTGARDTSPLAFAYQPFDNATGYVKLAGSALANLTGAQFDFSNGLEAVETIRADMMIDGIDETIRKASGTANLRFGTDATIDDVVDANSPVALEFGFTIAAQPTWLLKFSLPRVFFERTKKSITGPGGIEQPTSWRAAYDSTAGYLMQVELRNDVASY